MKKTLSILLSFVMLLSITAGVNLSAAADTVDSNPEHFDINLYDDGTAYVCAYTGDSERIAIPEAKGGVKITGIANRAFKGSNVISIALSSAVKNLDASSFEMSNKLEKITVHESNPYFSSADGVLFNKSKTELVCFPKYKNSESYTIPDTVITVCSAAFQNNMYLDSITIPAGLKTFEKYAFNAANLTKVYYNGSLADWCGITFASYANPLECKCDLYIGGKLLTDVHIPSSVKSISDNAFSNCRSIKTVTLPESVETLGTSAFRTCNSMTKITILNPNCKILDVTNKDYYGTIPKMATIYAYANSTAKKFADLFDNEFVAVKCSSHSYKTTTKTTKATKSANGKVVTTYTCKTCGYTYSKTTKTIYKPTTYTLSTSTYTYNGSAKKPSVTIKDSKGNKLKSGTDYTVTYPSGRKNVGKYTIKITFKGNYSGTATKSFTIKPKNTSLSSVSAGSKKFTVKWKKYTTQTTGYQIQYSTDKNFKKN
ncbi:MAG: leucine-rich repeat domain-containing protein, partial [Clostridium sp.]|nr:leucine-rich repeat domain-containing protein [Clostridium sp.]